MEMIPEVLGLVLEDVAAAMSEFGAVLRIDEAVHFELLAQRHGLVLVHRHIDSLGIDQIQQ